MVHRKQYPPLRWLSRFTAVLVLLTSLAGCTIATIKPLDPTTGKAIIGNEDQQFNAANLVAEMWDSQVLTTLQESATPVNTVLDALRQNVNSASETYGHRPGNEQPYSFMVTGTGKVIEVNITSRAGMATVDTTSDGQPDLTLAIGPVIRGTSLRDALPFISFNQFTNQMEYAAVSNQLNALVNEKVLAPIGDVLSLQNKTVTFYGAFTVGSDLTPSNVVVTPAILTVTG